MGSKNDTNRKQRGRVDDTVMFPVAPNHAEVPDNYVDLLKEIKGQILKTRLTVVMAGNSAMVQLYWKIGRTILEKQESQGWGSKVIDRLSADLREQFPEMKGFSPRNLKYMRAFAKAWPDFEIVQQLVAQLSWGHQLVLLDKLNDTETRLWYVRYCLQHGISRNILALQIPTGLHLRQGKAQNNFEVALPPFESDMATQIFKDPYLFDFLGTDAPRLERELEQGLMDHVQKFLLELGQGFAFVGRQVHLELGDSDFYLDLLFYHLKLRRYVVIELKAREFEIGDGAQLGMYLTAVNRLINHPQDEPSIGLLLVRNRNKLLVEYALSGTNHPIGVADWQTQLTQELPDDLRGSLPTIEEIEAELGGFEDGCENDAE